MDEVIEILNKLNIKFDIVNHPAVYTSEEADFYVKDINCSKAKNLFLAGKSNKNFYLFIIKDTKRLDIKKVSKLTQDRLHFASKNSLKEKMNLTPGTVSIFGLINNKEHDIKTYIDKELLNKDIIAFHPNDNTATMLINTNDILKFLQEMNFDYKIIDL